MKTYTHTYTHIYTHTHTHTYVYTYTHTYTHIHIQLKHMAQRHAYSQPIETYSLAPHNRNIWPSPTPTANQYKHMAERLIIETYGHTIAGRRRRRHAWPILLSAFQVSFYSLLASITCIV